MGGSAESTDSENNRKEKSENADMLACIATLTNGKSYPLQNPKMEEGKTTPKKHFTEDSLLSAMERAGADEMPDEVESEPPQPEQLRLRSWSVSDLWNVKETKRQSTFFRHIRALH